LLLDEFQNSQSCDTFTVLRPLGEWFAFTADPGLTS
jgi:hypothetical protein